MAYRICKTVEIESGHQLSKHPDVCRFPHGHSRKLEIVLEADTLDTHEMVCDFKKIKEIVRPIMRQWDHALAVNTQDPRYSMLKEAYGERIVDFPNEDPTTEVMARTLFHKIQSGLIDAANHPSAIYPVRKEVRLVSVKLWETSSSWAEYFE